MRIRILLSLLAVSAANLGAQVLNDFSAFANPTTTYFNGTWAAAGTSDPAGAFSQGAGVFNVVGGSNDGFSGVDHYYLDASGNNYVPISLGTNRFLALDAMLLSATPATSLTITLLDNSASTNTAKAVFDLSSFSTSGYTKSYVPLTTLSANFDWTAIQGFKISGGMTGGTDLMSISFNSLDAVSAVPEPATYAAILGLVTLGLVGYRRFRRS